MYEIVGGLRATLLSAVKQLAARSGVVSTHKNPQYFIHDVMLRYLLSVLIKINSLNNITGNNPRSTVDIAQRNLPFICNLLINL